MRRTRWLSSARFDEAKIGREGAHQHGRLLERQALHQRAQLLAGRLLTRSRGLALGAGRAPRARTPRLVPAHGSPRRAGSPAVRRRRAACAPCHRLALPIRWMRRCNRIQTLRVAPVRHQGIGLCVEAVQDLVVASVDNRPLDLHCRRELARGLERARSRIAKCLICSIRAKCALTASTAAWISARTRSSCAIVAGSAGMPIPAARRAARCRRALRARPGRAGGRRKRPRRRPTASASVSVRSPERIARRLGRSPATIRREIARHGGRGRYPLLRLSGERGITPDARRSASALCTQRSASSSRASSARTDRPSRSLAGRSSPVRRITLAGYRTRRSTRPCSSRRAGR
jgi:hypothetical protein